MDYFYLPEEQWIENMARTNYVNSDGLCRIDYEENKRQGT